MTERQEEQATLEALHMLEAEESRIFASEIRYSPKTLQSVADLRYTVAELALLLPSIAPPPSCKTKLLTTIANQPNAAQVRRKRSRALLMLGVLGWVAAATFGYLFFLVQQRIFSMQDYEAQARGAGAKITALQTDKTKLQAQLTETTTKANGLASQLTAIRNSSTLVGLDVSALHAVLKSWEDSQALAVWDNTKQEGILKLSNMHPMPAGRELQLWILDKDKPVNAGVIRLKEQGATIYPFKPAAPVTEATKFVISSEAQGGPSAGPPGPTIMSSP